MKGLTLGEVGSCGCDGDSDRQCTTTELGEVEGCSEGAGDESTNGEDRIEGDHHEGGGTTRSRAGDVH